MSIEDVPGRCRLWDSRILRAFRQPIRVFTRKNSLRGVLFQLRRLLLQYQLFNSLAQPPLPDLGRDLDPSNPLDQDVDAHDLERQLVRLEPDVVPPRERARIHPRHVPPELELAGRRDRFRSVVRDDPGDSGGADAGLEFLGLERGRDVWFECEGDEGCGEEDDVGGLGGESDQAAAEDE